MADIKKDVSSEKKRFSIGDLFYNNRFILPFAIVVSIILWMTINISLNTIREGTIAEVSANVSLTPQLEALKLTVISSNDQKASVIARGPNSVISSLKAEDVLIVADVSAVTKPGRYDIPLSAVPNSKSNKTGYTILSVDPPTISVEFDNIETKSFQISTQVEGISAVEGLIVYKEEITKPDFMTINISGPKTEIDKIATVRALVKPSSDKVLSETENFKTELELLDESGNVLDQKPYTMPFDTVEVTVPIFKSKTLPIYAKFINAPGVYADNNIPYTLSVDTVDVIGPPQVIDELTSVDLVSIDFDEIGPGSNTFDKALSLPGSVINQDNLESVTVTVNAGGLAEKMVNVTEIEPINTGSGLTANITQTLKNVRIIGPADVVNAIDAKDVYAEVDISGKPAGEHTVDARIKVRNRNDVWQFNTYKVRVTVAES